MEHIVKSKQYQYRIVEVSFDQGKLNNFPVERGIGHLMVENEIADEIVALKEELAAEMFEIINSDLLTDHQKKILTMRMLGKTQNEIADHLGITQSAVHKAMHGNIDYKHQRKRYGGIVKKLKKVCDSNVEIQRILCEIQSCINSRSNDNDDE